MRKMLVLATVLPLAAMAGPARAQGAVQAEQREHGRRVAETWCANCHLIGPGARGPAADAAPPFDAVARMPSTTAMSLRAFLQTPHARMPDYRLTGEELDGVVTWILALRPH